MVIIQKLVNSKNSICLTHADVVPIIRNFKKPSPFSGEFRLSHGDSERVVFSPESFKRLLRVNVDPNATGNCRASLPIPVMLFSRAGNPILRAYPFSLTAIAGL